MISIQLVVLVRSFLFLQRSELVNSLDRVYHPTGKQVKGDGLGATICDFDSLSALLRHVGVVPVICVCARTSLSPSLY